VQALKLTRGGRLSGDLTSDVARLTSSAEHDLYIADDVVEINLAYVLLMTKAGLLSREEGRLLSSALANLTGSIKAIPPKMEDVHMVIENEVTNKVGPEVGGKLHTGKSRNDQVATALRMRLREFLLRICRELLDLEECLLTKASKNIETIMPGFTHLQHAQPVTVAHYLLAYHDIFRRDLDRIVSCYGRVNLSPMGAAALAGTGYKIDRLALAKYLGFDGLVENTMDAVASRDFALEAAAVLALLMVDVSRLAEEVVVWSSFEFGYLKLPDDHSSTSSIMPQKKNPVTAEILRAKCGDVFGELSSMITIMKALPLTYNLDMQEVTPHLWRACEASSISLRVLADLIRKMDFDSDRLREVVRKDFSVATELADLLVREGGLPFRKSHQIVGGLVRDLCASSSSLTEESPERLSDMLFRSAGVKISADLVKRAVDPVSNVNIRTTLGGPSFAETRRMADERAKDLAEFGKKLSAIEALLKEREKSMRSALLRL
jgi:argininosuccinate lyase